MECLRIISGVNTSSPIFNSPGPLIQGQWHKALHLKDFCCASRRTKQFFFSRWRKNKKIRIFAVVSEVVGSSSTRDHASMLVIVEQTHNPLDVTPLLVSWTVDKIRGNVMLVVLIQGLDYVPNIDEFISLGATWALVWFMVMKLRCIWRFQNAQLL